MKKSILLLFLFISVVGLSKLIAAVSSPQFIQGADTLVVYSDVPGLTPSDKYTIRVRSAATNNVWVDVFANFTKNLADPALTTLNSPDMYQVNCAGWSHAYGNIEMNNGQAVEVEIAAKPGFKIGGQDFVKAKVHPAQKASAATLVGGKIYFTITKPGQIYIDINGQMDDYNRAINPIGQPVHVVTLWANPVIKKPTLTGLRVRTIEPGTSLATINAISPSTYDTMYFKPGVHDLASGIKMHPGKTIYIPGDAFIYGCFNNQGVPAGSYGKNGENITIYGYGTICGEKIPHYQSTKIGDNLIIVDGGKSIEIENGKNYNLFGVTLTDPSNHSIECNGENGSIKWLKTITWRVNGDGLGGYTDAEDCFIRAHDDCSYLKANRTRCTYWKDSNARLFYMAGMPENTTNPIIIEDCDVLYARLRTNPGTNGGGFNAGDGLAGQRPVNLIIRNIRFHDKRINMSVFNLSTTTGSSFAGILFQNISIAGMAPGNMQKILGSATSPWYGGLTFDNVTINDTLLTSSNFSRFFTTNAYVSGVIFKNSLNYTLTINNCDTGTVVSSPSLQNYADGTAITLTAVPKAGYAFKNWSGDVSGTTNPTTFAITSNMVVSANYQRANSYTSTTPGSSSWIVPVGVDSITINVWGAGGAGGSAELTVTTTANTQIRSGGGAGGSFAGSKIAVTPGQVISYNIGAGAIAPVSGFADDASSTGGNTSCGTTIAVGGTGGKSKTTAVAGFPTGSGGIAPITGNTGTVKFYGGNGGNASSTGSGGGGGSAGSAGNGGNATNNVAGIAGAGVASGAAGAAGTNLVAVGNDGFVPGSGGSGAAIRATGGTTPAFKIGGRGGNGKILITYKINQTITFPALATKTVGEADFNPGATASSVLAVTYTSSNTAVATIVNGNIHIIGAGTCNITASQSGDATYKAAPSVVQSLVVQPFTVKINQTITFSALATKTVGEADFSPGATASSGLAVTYTSSNTAVATIVSGNIHIIGAGTSNITASQSGNATYNAAPSIVQSLTVKINQTITFPALATKTVGDADFSPGATASSVLAVTYTSSNTAVATIVSGNIHIIGAGTSNITASQSGNATYNAAPSVVQSLIVNPIPGFDAFWRIEAESYNSMLGVITETCGEGGQDIGNVHNGDYIVFNNVDFGTGAASFEARVASATAGGSIEVRLGSLTGTVLGTCAVTNTGGWQTWTTKTCAISGVSGAKNIYLKFIGGTGFLFNLNWFKFIADVTTHTSWVSGTTNNKFYENLNVYFSNADISREIKVFNIFGQLVYSTKTESANVQINVQSLKLKGILMVQIIEGNSVVNHKILVK